MGLLEGRTALVTGAARGIGLAVARAMAGQGARVVLSDREPPPDVPGGEALRLDVADAAATEAAFEALAARGIVPDVVVPNAGILHLGPAEETPPDRFREVVEVNLTGAFLTARAAAPRMRAGGSVIFTTSLFGVRGGAGNAAYAASKFGMRGLMESMAADLAPRGVRVNAVAPGQIATEMMEVLVARRRAEGRPDPRERLVARIPMGRLGTPEELADTYVWLASDLAAYVTGQTIVVDGGWQVG